ncbi:MAG: DNA methyltransferase [Promethearchaeota archaeon]
MSPKYLWKTDFFKWAKNQPDHSFDAIITDPPYTSFRNKIGEDLIGDNSFNIKDFCSEVVRLLKPDGIFVSFCSIHLMKDYFFYFKDKLPFRCEQIWDKRPYRTWISNSLPLRHIEYIVYFGKGKLDFRNGLRKKSYHRSQFGGDLRSTTKNTKKFAEGQFEQILNFPIPKKTGKSYRDIQKYNNLSNKYKFNNNFEANNEFNETTIERIKVHPTRKPPEFSEYFKKVLVNAKKVLDPCCGTGALICSFKNAIGIDIKEWIPVKPPSNYKNINLEVFMKSPPKTEKSN